VDQSSLEWVIVDGSPRHVSAFAELRPKRRPRAYCPQCARPLTLKLGSIRRHHAAHEPGEVCAATQPETALHINCKLALAATLSAAAGTDAILATRRQCAGPTGSASPCSETLVREWLRGWDDVQIERRAGNALRPDILLVRARAVIGAVEILVSHAVPPEKAQALADLGVDWIEIRADERLATPGGWTPRDPLPVLHASDEREWRCDTHRTLHAAALKARDATRLAEREAARHSSVLIAARVVDVYHAGGVRERLIYRVSELATDAQAHSMRLQRGGLEVATTPVAESALDRRAAWSRLRSAFEADVDHLMGDDHSFADSPMRWARGDAAENIVDEALADRVGRDPTPLVTRFPRRWFYAKESERWFLPPDMRHVRWDRDPADAFAAHPAWTRTRSAVRERPAPEDSWTTPVFASRPVAAMFRDHVRSATPYGAGSMVLVELESPAVEPRRAIVVIERATPDSAIASRVRELDVEGVQSVWLSHPSDWTPALDAVAWVPAGRDSRGRGCVVVDGLGIFRADQFTRAWSARDPRLDAAAIRGRMAARVERMRAR
jgi:hypothetical protein